MQHSAASEAWERRKSRIWYAYQFRSEYTYVFWCSAASHDALYHDAVAIAHELSLPLEDETILSKVVADVRHWLGQQADWLLILDNADDLEVAREIIPNGGRGHLLLTTRQRTIGDLLAQPIVIDSMKLEEGSLFLLRRCGIIALGDPLESAERSDFDQAKAISNELGGLPLALHQAAAYIVATPSTLKEYLELYQSYGPELRKMRGDCQWDYPESVATTWLISLQKVKATNPAAADLLDFCALLAPDAIPEEIFTAAAEDLGEYLGPAAANQLKFLATVKEAGRYSLIERNPKAKTLYMHRLVQLVQKDGFGYNKYRMIACNLIKTLSRITDFKYSINVYKRHLIVHLLHCICYIKEFGFDFPEAMGLLYRTSKLLCECGQYVGKEPLAEWALELTARTLGADHPDTLACRNNLASVYLHAGRTAEAIALFEYLVGLIELKLAPDVHKLTIHNNLAEAYKAAGRTAEAIALHESTLKLRETVLGPDHPDTLVSQTNLAKAYQSAGRTGEAIALHESTLKLRETVLVPDHPDILTTRNFLAEAYIAAGRIVEAIALLESTLKFRETVLGPDHPDTLTTRNDLAVACQRAGRTAEAIALHESTLKLRETVLGPDHPDTLTTRNNLAAIYQVTGRTAEAIAHARVDAQVAGNKAGRRSPKHFDYPQQPRNGLPSHRSHRRGNRVAGVDV